jgi:hypothetical protein
VFPVKRIRTAIKSSIGRTPDCCVRRIRISGRQSLGIVRLLWTSRDAGKNTISYVTRRFTASLAGLSYPRDWTFAETPLYATVRILLIARSVGRPIVEAKEIDTSFGMSLPEGISLSNADKLELLQRLDQFQKWNSLDDKRYCLWCNKIITGYEIQVIGGTRGTGPLRIICATKGCHSIPMDWTVPSDEALSKYRGHVA